MREQHGHSAGELPLFGFAHVFDFVRNVFDVEMREVALAQETRLLLRPADHILFVKRPRHPADRSSRRPQDK